MPIRNVMLTNVTISGEKGLEIRNAEVTMKNVVVKPASGDAIVKEEGAVLK